MYSDFDLLLNTGVCYHFQFIATKTMYNYSSYLRSRGKMSCTHCRDKDKQKVIQEVVKSDH